MSETFGTTDEPTCGPRCILPPGHGLGHLPPEAILDRRTLTHGTEDDWRPTPLTIGRLPDPDPPPFDVHAAIAPFVSKALAACPPGWELVGTPELLIPTADNQARMVVTFAPPASDPAGGRLVAELPEGVGWVRTPPTPPNVFASFGERFERLDEGTLELGVIRLGPCPASRWRRWRHRAVVALARLGRRLAR